MEKADKEYSDDFPISKIPDWIFEFFDQCHPERLNPETCDHSGINIMQNLDKKSKKCLKCDSVFTRCDSLNSMET